MKLPLPILAPSSSHYLPLQHKEGKLAAVAPPNGARRGELHPEPEKAALHLLLADIREAAMAGGPICPSCCGREVVRWGTRKGVQRYRCKQCEKCFTELTDTVLEGLHLREKFLSFCLCMMKGMTVKQAASEVGISPNTSFAWRHRILSRLEQADSATKLSGVVELAQRDFAVSFKGSRNIPEYALRSSPGTSFPVGLGYSRNRTPERRAYFLIGVDRAGKVRSEVVGIKGGKGYGQVMSDIIHEDALVCARKKPGQWHPVGEYRKPINWVDTPKRLVRRKTRTLQGPLCHANNAKSLVLRWRNWMRQFCGVATKYMVRYASWFWRVLAAQRVGTKAAAEALFFEVLKAPRSA